MELHIGDVHYNITVEDLEDAAIEFSFWRGRRFSLLGKDTAIHSLRFNDIVAGVLAEDAIFENDEDRQAIFATLDRLKGQGYPYTGSCATHVMLWIKQFFGNFSREELLDQLREKLCTKEEEESLTEDESETKTLISPLYNSHPRDLLPLILNSAGKATCLPLMSTCKLFYEIINSDEFRLNYFRDFKLLKQIFNTQNPSKKFDALLEIKHLSIPLLAEFDSKEMINKIREIESTSIHDNPSNYDFLDEPIPGLYSNHLTKLGMALARINPKGALKIAALIDEKSNFFDYFCVLTAVAKNSTLCDRNSIIEKGKQHIQVLLSYPNPHGAFMLLEAFIGLDNGCAFRMIELLRSLMFDPQSGICYYTKYLAEVIQRIDPSEIGMRDAVANLIGDIIKLNYSTSSDSDKNDKYASEKLILVAKGFTLFDKEKAREALDLALALVETGTCIECLEYEKYTRSPECRVVDFLADIAGIFAEFDKQRATEVINQALEKIEICFTPAYYERYWRHYFEYRNTLLDLLNKIFKISAAIDKNAIQVREESAEKVLVLEIAFSEHYQKHKGKDYHRNYLDRDPFADYPSQLFMGAIDILAPYDREEASKMANSAVEWAKTLPPSEEWDKVLVKLSHALLKNFPDQALEVAEVIKAPRFKCKAFHSIISHGSA